MEKVTKPTFITKNDHERPCIIFDSTKSKSSGSESLTRDEIDSLQEEIRASCSKLKKYSKLQKTDLDEESFALLQETAAKLAAVYRTEDYEKVHQILLVIFADYIDSEPGTVADFFVGCSGKLQHSGKIGCDVKCAGNVPSPANSEWKFCGFYVARYRNGELERSYNPDKKTDVILIHVMDEKCELTKEEVASLKKEGISKCMLSYHYNGKYREDKDLKDLDSLVRKPKFLAKNPNPKKSHVLLKKPEKEEKEESTFGSWLWIVVFIIFIIFVVLVIWAVAFRTPTSYVKHDNYVDTRTYRY